VTPQGLYDHTATMHCTNSSRAMPNPNATRFATSCIEERLLQYLRTCLVSDTALTEVAIRQLLSAAGDRPLKLNLMTSDKSPMPLLHLVVLNEATPAPALQNILAILLQLGAVPETEDEDGDNALAALLEVATEHENDGEAISEGTLVAQLGALQALLPSTRLRINQKELCAVCAWLRRFAAKHPKSQRHVLKILEARCGADSVAIVWRSEQFLAYLDGETERRCSLQAQRVRDFLATGASPRHSQNGATALLMVILNPYTTYEELVAIFRCMLENDPMSATVRDGFKRLPLQWAADYCSISSQHKLPRPNPAILLALLPTVVETLPADVDAGEICFKTAREKSRCTSKRISLTPKLRFKEGDHVLCRVEAPHHHHNHHHHEDCSPVWEEGIIVELWYREACWPDEHPGAPYEVQLALGMRVFALADNDRIIRKKQGESRGAFIPYYNATHCLPCN